MIDYVLSQMHDYKNKLWHRAGELVDRHQNWTFLISGISEGCRDQYDGLIEAAEEMERMIAEYKQNIHTTIIVPEG